MTKQQMAYRSYDGPYDYTGVAEVAGRCYLQVWEPRGHLPIVIATEVADNPGPSVTNAAAALATQVWRSLLPSAAEGFRYLEVYLDPTYPEPEARERFAEVTFALDGYALSDPQWRASSRGEVEAVIGGPFSVPFTSSY